MSALAAIFLLSPIATVLGPILVALMVALLVFCAGAGIQLSTVNIAALSVLAAAIPISAFLGAAFLRRVTERSDARRGSIELLATVLAAALALRSGSVVTLFGAASFLSTSRVPGAPLLTVSLTVGHALFAAGLAAFVVSVVTASADLVSGWFARNSGSKRIVIPALRQIIALLAISAGFDLMIGLFSRELAPFTILQGII